MSKKYNIVRLIVHQGKKVGRDVSARQNLQKTRRLLREEDALGTQPVLEQKPAPKVVDDPYWSEEAAVDELYDPYGSRALPDDADSPLDTLLDDSPETVDFTRKRIETEVAESEKLRKNEILESTPSTGNPGDTRREHQWPLRSETGNKKIATKSSNKVLKITPKKKSTKVPVVFRKSTHRRGGKPDGDHVMAYFDHKANEIIIDPELALQKYNEKAWLKPKVPGVKPLPKDSFDTYKDWERFLVEHEQAHTRLPRLKDEAYHDYENRMNDEAFRVIGKRNKYKKKPKKK